MRYLYRATVWADVEAADSLRDTEARDEIMTARWLVPRPDATNAVRAHEPPATHVTPNVVRNIYTHARARARSRICFGPERRAGEERRRLRKKASARCDYGGTEARALSGGLVCPSR